MDKSEKLQSIIRSNSEDFIQVYNQRYLANADEYARQAVIMLTHSDSIYLAISEVLTGGYEKAKQNFYLSSKAALLLIGEFDEKLFDYDIKVLCVALLSDCSEVINRLATIRHSSYEPLMKTGDSTIIYVFQAAIREDWEEFDSLMEIVKTKTLKKLPIYRYDFDFFKCLKEKDKAGCEAAINGLLEKRLNNARNKYSIYKDFFSFPALGYAKLAWLKGLEVDIDHELVPKQLLPVKPNDVYVDEYDFLKDE